MQDAVLNAGLTNLAPEPGQRPSLEVRNLKVELGAHGGRFDVIRGIDLTVHPRETVCLVGESGCGKTITSLALLDQLPKVAKVTADRMDFEGIDLRKLSKRAFSDIRGDRMAMIFQDPMTSLNPVYTIGNQLVEVFTRHGKGTKKEGYERVEYLLERVGIKSPRERIKAYPHELSGGLRQRMVIAMALMCNPSLIIADEPTTALDVTVQAMTLGLLKDLQDEFGVSMVFITHDLGIVSRIADRVEVMYAGQIVESGTTEEIFTQPSHPYTQGLIDCIPIPGKTKRGSRLGSIPGVVPSLVGAQHGCSFRNRCPYSTALCAELAPPFRSSGSSHGYQCHFEPAERLPHEEEARTWLM